MEPNFWKLFIVFGKVKRLKLSDCWMSMLDFTLQIWYFYHFYEEGFFRSKKLLTWDSNSIVLQKKERTVHRSRDLREKFHSWPITMAAETIHMRKKGDVLCPLWCVPQQKRKKKTIFHRQTHSISFPLVIFQTISSPKNCFTFSQYF